MTYQHILYDVSEKIATITLNRPDRMNAWTPIMERDVRHAMEAASGDDNVRVIVLTGAGRAFCAGADMDALKGLDPDDIKRAGTLPPFDMNRRPDWQARYAYYPSIAKPVIAHAERRHRRHRPGACAVLRPALCRRQHRFHHRVFAPRPDRRAWHQLDAAAHCRPCQRARSVDVRAPGLERRSAAHRAGQPAVSAGSVARATYAYARDLADFVSPSAIAVIKRQLYDVPFQTLAEATIDANREMVVALRGSDFREGVASFMEKRPPRFTGK